MQPSDSNISQLNMELRSKHDVPIKPHRSLQAGGSGGGDGGGGEGGGDGEVCAAAELRRIKTARKNIRVSACMDIFGWRLRAILFCALLGTCVGDIPRRCRAWLQLDWCICFRANGLQAWPLFGVPTAQLLRRALDTAFSSQSASTAQSCDADSSCGLDERSWHLRNHGSCSEVSSISTSSSAFSRAASPPHYAGQRSPRAPNARAAPAARLSFSVTSRPALTRLSTSPRMGYESMTIEEMEAQMNEKLKALEAAESAAPAEPAPAPVAAAPEAPIAAPEPAPVAAPAGDDIFAGIADPSAAPPAMLESTPSEGGLPAMPSMDGLTIRR